VAIRIADEAAPPEAEPRLRQRERSAAHQEDPRLARHAVRGRGIGNDELDLPMADVIGLEVGRGRTAVPEAQGLEQFDARTNRSAERGDAELGSEDIVEPLLLRTLVLALACPRPRQRR